MNAEEIGSYVMVDTLGIRIPNVDADKLPNKYMHTRGGTEREWYKGRLTSNADKVTLRVNAKKATRTCDMEGSISMHRQGHNIVSSNNVKMLAYVGARDLNRGMNLGLGYDRAAEFVRGRGMSITRLDTPVLLKKPHGQDTQALINGLAIAAIAAGHNASVYSGESVYFDQSSQLRAVKVYDKAAEVASRRKLQIPETGGTERLMRLTGETLRLEAVYRKKWLDRRYKEDCSPSRFTPDELGLMLLEVLEKYDLRRDLRRGLDKDEIWNVPAPYRLALLRWQSGHRNTDDAEFGAAHAYLLAKHNLNIRGPHPRDLLWAYQIGEILSPSNFVHVPEEIRTDNELFYSCDMDAIEAEIDAHLRPQPPNQQLLLSYQQGG